MLWPGFILALVVGLIVYLIVHSLLWAILAFILIAIIAGPGFGYYDDRRRAYPTYDGWASSE
jgi:uncharacterized RDD family membrane protein YckC